MQKLLLMIGALFFLNQSAFASGVALTITDIGSGTPDANTMYGESIIKAWLRFDGTVPEIDGDYNVASFTDHAVGQYTFNWDRDFANTNYAVVCMASYTENIGHWSQDSGWIRVAVGEFATNFEDDNNIYCIAIGNQ